MVSKVLSTVAKMLPEEIESGTEDSLQWFRQNVRDLKIKPIKIMKGLDTVTNTGLRQGGVYMFHYDAKWKDTLPYWDKYPIVVPLELYNNGFLGINLHYLSMPMRLRLLDRLVDYSNNNKFDESTRLRVDYSKLKRVDLIKPCLKRYLAGQVKSKFRKVEADEFMVATLLPVQRFKKQSDSHIFAKSRGMV